MQVGHSLVCGTRNVTVANVPPGPLVRGVSGRWTATSKGVSQSLPLENMSGVLE